MSWLLICSLWHLAVLQSSLLPEQFYNSAAPLLEEDWGGWRTLVFQGELRPRSFVKHSLCCNTLLKQFPSILEKLTLNSEGICDLLFQTLFPGQWSVKYWLPAAWAILWVFYRCNDNGRPGQSTRQSMVHKDCAQHDLSDFAAGTPWAGVCSKGILQSHSQTFPPESWGQRGSISKVTPGHMWGLSCKLTRLLRAPVYKQGDISCLQPTKKLWPFFLCDIWGQ